MKPRHLRLVVDNGPVDPRSQRKSRKYDRLTTRVLNERGEHVYLPAIPRSGGAA